MFITRVIWLNGEMSKELSLFQQDILAQRSRSSLESRWALSPEKYYRAQPKKTSMISQSESAMLFHTSSMISSAPHQTVIDKPPRLRRSKPKHKPTMMGIASPHTLRKPSAQKEAPSPSLTRSSKDNVVSDAQTSEPNFKRSKFCS